MWYKRLLLILITLCMVFVSTFGFTQESGETLVYGEYGAPIRLVPILANDSISIRLIELIYGSLVYYSNDGEIKGDLAKTWEISKDLKKITFRLREDVKWHPVPGMEGSFPFSADDVVKTFTLMMTPKTVKSLQSRYSFISSVKKIDDYTVVFMLKKPLLNVLGRFSFKILPSFLLEDVTFLQGDESRKGRRQRA